MTEMIKRLCGEIHLPTFLLCSGCLFPVSVSFPATAEILKEKWAFVVILVILISGIKYVLGGKEFICQTDKILKAFVLLCVVEMKVAILQLLSVLPSFHSFFRFTGTFGNPSVFAMMMSLCMPICVYYIIRSTGRGNSAWYALMLCVLLCIVLSESRTSLIAAVCSSLVITFIEVPRYRYSLSNRKIILSFFVVSIVLLTFLYYYKRDSADGRALIWTVSLKMIAEKPMLGWGADGFSASYMPYQAEFLSEKESGLAYLADNISHPFNEFLLICIKYGMAGFAMLACAIVFIVRICLNTNSVYRSLYLGMFLTLFIHSLFSYPYTVPIIWVSSVFLVCSVIGGYCQGSPKRQILMLLLLSGSFIGVLYHERHIYYECQWQRLQNSTLSVKRIYREYEVLYNHLNGNPSFLYNYGAWLHHNGYYLESLRVLDECRGSYDDYNVELLIADNYKQLGNAKMAIDVFEYANAMIPSRFLPLYYVMRTYEGVGDYVNASRTAKKIIEKPVKVDRSPSVRRIKDEAEMLMLTHHSRGIKSAFFASE